jgi:hypothetical protein
MTMLNTPAQINGFRFASLKGMLTMESKGMKTRGGPLRPRLAAEFGLRARAPYADYIAHCQKQIDAVLTEQV